MSFTSTKTIRTFPYFSSRMLTLCVLADKLLALKAGDFVEMDLDPLIQAKVDGVPVFDCYYGTSEGRYAIKIDRMLTGQGLSWLGDNNGS